MKIELALNVNHECETRKLFVSMWEFSSRVSNQENWKFPIDWQANLSRSFDPFPYASIDCFFQAHNKICSIFFSDSGTKSLI